MENEEIVFTIRLVEKGNQKAFLRTRTFQCNKFIAWAKENNEFCLEVWEAENKESYDYKLKEIATYKGIEWEDVYHNNPEDSICAAEANFTYKEKIVEPKEGISVSIPQTAFVEQRVPPNFMSLRETLAGDFVFGQISGFTKVAKRRIF